MLPICTTFKMTSESADMLNEGIKSKLKYLSQWGRYILLYGYRNETYNHDHECVKQTAPCKALKDDAGDIENSQH